MTHPGILANLRESLRVDADGHYLVAGPARVPVELEDAPFVVVRVAVEGERLVATLNDLSEEPLDPGSLSFDGAGVPRCRVKGGMFAARLSRAATYQLLDLVEDDERASQAILVVGSRRHPIDVPPDGPPIPPPVASSPPGA